MAAIAWAGIIGLSDDGCRPAMSAAGTLRTIFRYATAWPLVLLAGCKFITIHSVNTDIDLQIEGRDADGKSWRAPAGEIVRQPLYPGSTQRFTRPVYEGPLVSWRMGASLAGSDFVSSTGGVEYVIRNKLPVMLCFRFDQAMLSSNLHPQEVAMRVRHAEQHSRLKPFVPHPNPQGERPIVTPPPFCFEPGEPNDVWFSLDTAELFPSGHLFDLRWEGKDTHLLNQGIGNSLRMRLPIEYAGKREEMTVTITVMESKAHLQLY